MSYIIKMKADDAGVLVGNIKADLPYNRFGVEGIQFYKPDNDLIPRVGMSINELLACYPSGFPDNRAADFKLEWSQVKRVLLADTPIFLNRDYFDLQVLGIPLQWGQSTIGRGPIELELVNPNNTILHSLEQKIGFKISPAED